MGVVAAFGPIWILTAAGYLARRLGLVGQQATAALGRLVFHLAMPAALFLTLSKTPVTDLGAGRALIAFGASMAIVIVVGWVLAERWHGRRDGEPVIWGMAAGYVNSANLGLPVALHVLGDASFMAQALLLQVLVVTPLILIALERRRGGGRMRLRRVAGLPLRNPIILGSALGVAVSVSDVPLPVVAQTSLALLAAAAVPLALLTLGASLHRDQPASRVPLTEVAAVTSLKVLGQPLVAYGIGLALQLTPAQLLAVVVCAALPTAQNTFIFAQEHQAGEEFASRVVLLTTMLSLGILAAAPALLS
ncbi:AEC family transporter [Pilimelia columellifera]|uniref:AEC family transporter n=1 Tax=Pilimelia columellifera subsp. columellifera TaxID=706583 RepID=A0ABN3NPB7_9ACTN